jgi:hypothetical protein
MGLKKDLRIRNSIIKPGRKLGCSISDLFYCGMQIVECGI